MPQRDRAGSGRIRVDLDWPSSESEPRSPGTASESELTWNVDEERSGERATRRSMRVRARPIGETGIARGHPVSDGLDVAAELVELRLEIARLRAEIASLARRIH